jgi:2,3-bisphosphoglycerate-independent phosphoglycerate mutase
MGNSEVGHLNIGGGRVIYQNLPRISKAISDGSFYKNEAFREAFRYAKKNKKPVHLLGLLSDGGVHSHQEHLFALLELAKKEKLDKIYLHIFTDGRDTAQKSAILYIKKLEKKINTIKIGRIATICGRYFAMDRDNRWERTKKAYEALVLGRGEIATSPEKAVELSYRRHITDEFMRPVIVDPKGIISDGDVVIFWNLRTDRPRQLSKALIEQGFREFRREKVAKELYFVSMTEYDKDLPVKSIAFPQSAVKNCLAEVLAREGCGQLHIAETEKYAHVTYFLNGGREKPFKGEERILIPSPKVATYDEKPEMSAEKITEKLLKVIGEKDFIVVNFANLDMVGHTGDFDAAVIAAETVDKYLGELIEKAVSEQYTTFVTADHGNAEEMLEDDGTPKTSHTNNPVPFIVVDETMKLEDKNGKLANIAPTILDIMEIDIPEEMTEKSLVKTKGKVHV